MLILRLFRLLRGKLLHLSLLLLMLQPLFSGQPLPVFSIGAIPGVEAAAPDAEPTFTPRSPLVASALSGLIPGGGQFYNRQPVKGFFVAAGELVGFLGIAYSILSHSSEMTPAAWLLPIGYAASIIDGGWSAYAYNRRMIAAGYRPAPPVPTRYFLALGMHQVIGENELWATMVEAEWRVIPAIGLSIAYSMAAGRSVTTDELIMGNVRFYIPGTGTNQVYVGWEAGVQERREGYAYKYHFQGPVVGVTVRPFPKPVELHASFSIDERGYAKGYSGVYKGARWTGGLRMVF
ncbi:MAG TPA: hypothetical protein GXX29_15105 [Firmicutes bacterium]|nr:hypothetical protein [Bacillota bacterium]